MGRDLKEEFFYRLEILDLMLNEINGTTLSDVNEWLEETYSELRLKV